MSPLAEKKEEVSIFHPAQQICGSNHPQIVKKGSPCLPSIHTFRLLFGLNSLPRSLFLWNMKSKVYLFIKHEKVWGRRVEQGTMLPSQAHCLVPWDGECFRSPRKGITSASGGRGHGEFPVDWILMNWPTLMNWPLKPPGTGGLRPSPPAC